MAWGKKRKEEKFNKKVENLKKAATDHNKKSPATKKATRRWGSSKDKDE